MYLWLSHRNLSKRDLASFGFFCESSILPQSVQDFKNMSYSICFQLEYCYYYLIRIFVFYVFNSLLNEHSRMS